MFCRAYQRCITTARQPASQRNDNDPRDAVINRKCAAKEKFCFPSDLRTSILRNARSRKYKGKERETRRRQGRRNGKARRGNFNLLPFFFFFSLSCRYTRTCATRARVRHLACAIPLRAAFSKTFSTRRSARSVTHAVLPAWDSACATCSVPIQLTISYPRW